MLYSTLQGSKSFLEVFSYNAFGFPSAWQFHHLVVGGWMSIVNHQLMKNALYTSKNFIRIIHILKKKWWAIMKLKRQENIFHQEPRVCIKSDFFFNLLFKAITFALIIYNGTTISWHSENSICSMKMSWKVLLIFSI